MYQESKCMCKVLPHKSDTFFPFDISVFIWHLLSFLGKFNLTLSHALLLGCVRFSVCVVCWLGGRKRVLVSLV